MRIVVVLLCTLPVSLMSFWIYTYTHDIAIEETKKNLKEQSDVETKLFDSTINTYFERIQGITSRTQLRLSLKSYQDSKNIKDLKKMKKILLDALNSIEGFEDISIYTQEATHLLSVGPFQYKTSPAWIEESFQFDQPIVKVVQVNGTFKVVVIAPLILNYKNIGAITLLQNANTILNISDNLNLYSESTRRLILLTMPNQKPTLITNSKDNLLLYDQLDQEKCMTHIYEAIVKNEFTLETCQANKIDFDLIALRPSQVGPFAFLIIHKSKFIYKYIQKIEVFIFLTMALVALFSFIISSYIGHSAFSPLEKLTQGIRSLVIKDDLSVLPVHRTDEIGLFANKLKDSLQELKNTTTSLADFEKLNLKLQEVNQTKDKFVAMATHDLRNPITILSMNLNMLLDGYFGELSPKQIEALKKQSKTIENMLTIVNDLLDVSQFESGELKLEKEKVSWNEWIQTFAEEYKDLAKYKNVKVLNQPAKQNIQIELDISRIQQAVMNFYTNAIKYTLPETSIILSSDLEEKHLVFSITDHGPGIPKVELDKLFIPFSKTSVRPTGGEKSIGLGLAIVKKIIEAHGGTVFVNSTTGQGSTFGFKIPLSSNS